MFTKIKPMLTSVQNCCKPNFRLKNKLNFPIVSATKTIYVKTLCLVWYTNIKCYNSNKSFDESNATLNIVV